MEKQTWKQSPAGKILIWVLLVALLTAAFYWVVAEDWNHSNVVTEPVASAGFLPWNGGGEMIITQTFTQSMDELEGILLVPGNYLPGNVSGSARFTLLRGQEQLWQQEIPCEQIPFDTLWEVKPAASGKKGDELTLKIETPEGGLTFQFGSMVSVGKYQLEAARDGTLQVNDQEVEGVLRMELHGTDRPNLAWLVWVLGALAALAGAAFLILADRSRRAGRLNLAGQLDEVWRRYSYLLKKLVMRDFRVKYQASILGFLWSFLNPLLTMFVYLFVFNTLFHSDVQNFPVYLLTGIILFNFFNESTTQGLESIVGNRQLITKVYMPKYIYPLAKVLSSAINLAISFIPLLAVILVTGMPFHRSMLLLPLVVLFLVMFSAGMSMIVATLNVFFRDTEFLWGILIMVWNFLTPVFYPESIIPAAYRTIYHMNPLYQIIYFMRCITIGGVSPTPVTYLYCFLASFIPLLVGIVVMKKKQDQFVLHL